MIGATDSTVVVTLKDSSTMGTQTPITSLRGASKSSNKEKISLTTTEKLYLSYLSEQLQSKVSLDKESNGKGKLIIHFEEEQQLQRLIEMLKKTE
jgi:hypothetical protein